MTTRLSTAFASRVFFIAAVLLASVRPIFGQHESLEEYVRLGLEDNLALRQKALDVEKAREALVEARRMFYPNLDLSARYSRAAGGRQFLVPIGDLLNPVYGTLNQLLEGQGIPGPFPQIENQTIPFLREREQETKVRVVQPIFQPQLVYSARTRRHLAEAEAQGLDAYRRDLVADIKTAVLNHQKAAQAVRIYESAATLVAENVRVNESLFRNGKVTQEAVFRAEAEQSTVRQQLGEAVRDLDLAAAYLNFLLNRPLDTPVAALSPEQLEREFAAGAGADVPPGALPDSADAAERALDRREELDRLTSAVSAVSANLKRERSAGLPGITFVFDYGIQGEEYVLDGDADFWMASVVLSWSLFDGLRRRTRADQTDLERQRLETQRDEVAQQIRLQVRQAVENVRVARESVETASDRLESAQQTFRLVDRKYEEGLANHVEWLDARTTLTTAELNQVLSRFDLLIRLTEYERAVGLYPL